MRPLCSISVDLDPIGCYYAIHGLARRTGGVPAALVDVVMRRGLPRFLDVLARRNISATLFVVGEDLVAGSRSGTQASRALVREAHAAGHELASHSQTHPYDLSRKPRAQIADEIDRAAALLGEITGAPPVGFRAPGYNVSKAVLEVLCERGYRYDSSVLPAPLYYSAKAAVMGAMRVRGRPSGSSLGDPRFLVAPREPYRPDRRAPWRAAGDANPARAMPLVELPIAVTPSLRVPVIGTYVLAGPAGIRRRLVAAARRMPFFNFELHGLDLVGADEDGLPAALVARQPDLRVPLADRAAAFEAALDALAADFDFAPLRDAAARFDA